MVAILLGIKRRLVQGLEWLVILALGALVLDVLWQVFTRFVLRDPSSWTDELATLLIVWVVLLGASVAFVNQGHLGVDYLVNKLSPANRLRSEILVFLLIGFFAGVVLLYGGSKLVALTLLTRQVSPALGVKMGHVYLAVPLSGFFILIFSLEAVMERAVRLCSRSTGTLSPQGGEGRGEGRA